MNNKKEYFNKHEFIKAKNISLVNPTKGIIAYQEYFSKYPKDYTAYTYYISLLINLNKLNEAAENLYYIEQIYFEEPIFHYNNERAKIFYFNILYCKLRLLCYQKRYQEFLILYHNNIEKLSSIKNEVSFYAEKKCGNLDLTRREPNSYLYRQIVEYREEDFKDHLKKHLPEYNDNDSKYSKYIFNPNLPIDEIIDEIKKYLPNDKKLCLGFMDNAYVFKYDECGRVNNKLVDYFKVITFDDTKDIITMCPSDECEYLPFIDINYMKENISDNDSKVKRLSQIDKFNMRYNRT